MPGPVPDGADKVVRGVFLQPAPDGGAHGCQLGLREGQQELSVVLGSRGTGVDGVDANVWGVGHPAQKWRGLLPWKWSQGATGYSPSVAKGISCSISRTFDVTNVVEQCLCFGRVTREAAKSPKAR